MLDSIVRAAHELIGTDFTYLSLVADGELVLKASEGTISSSFKAAHVSTGTGVGGRVIATGAPAWVRNYLETHDVPHDFAAVFRTQDEDAIWRANLDGTRNLIAAAEAHAGQARFVMASTGNVYRPDNPRPSREDDPCHPTAAYPAGKLAAEQLLRASTLTWSILRLPFVYGDDDGHLAMIPALAPRYGLHPANTYSVAHHRDIMTAVSVALTGAMDGRTVNITDDRPVTVLELAELAGHPIDGSAEPFANPWAGRMDGSLARELGFQPTVPTIYDAARAGIL